MAFLLKDSLGIRKRAGKYCWKHSGFSAHNQVRVAAEDSEGRRKLAGYMLRAPMAPEKLRYDTWRTKPSWHLIATDDKMIPPPAQRFMSKPAGSTVCRSQGQPLDLCI
jgi:hypothetical protein